MTDVLLKYNPYTNETFIQVNGKVLDETEIKEYVGAEENISGWVKNFWERISTKCNDDFTVHFCGLEADYMQLEQAFFEFKKRTIDEIRLESDYVINPVRINDEQYVKDELDIIFGKKCVERPVFKECSECKQLISEESIYCPICGKKQDGTERIDESRLYVENYLKKTEINNTIKEKFNVLYELLRKIFFIKKAVGKATSTDMPEVNDLNLSSEEVLRKLFLIRNGNIGDLVPFGNSNWRIFRKGDDKVFLLIATPLERKAIYLSEAESNFLIEVRGKKIFVPSVTDIMDESVSEPTPKKIMGFDFVKIDELFGIKPLNKPYSSAKEFYDKYYDFRWRLSDGWVSKNGNITPGTEHCSGRSRYIHAIIVDTSIIRNTEFLTDGQKGETK